MTTFPLFERKQDVGKFLARAEIFRRVLRVQGSVVECGVYKGCGLTTWAKLSAVYEPENYTRQVIGFDTFSGFPTVSEHDGGSLPGQIVGHSFQEVMTLVASSCDWDQPGYPQKAQLVVGDAAETIPRYISENPHLIVALLHLDFDLYEPTLVALKHFRPLMPKGAVIAFDELNMAEWPGETVAVNEYFGIDELKVRRFPYTSTLSYVVL